MSGERLPSLRVQRNVGLVYVPSFQTKALMIPTIIVGIINAFVWNYQLLVVNISELFHPVV